MSIYLELFSSYIKKRYLWFFCLISITLGYSFPYQSNSPIFAFFGYIFGFLGITLLSSIGHKQRRASPASLLFLGIFLQTLAQFQWLLSHPYWYIVLVWPVASLLISLPVSALLNLWMKYFSEGRFPVGSALLFSSFLASYEWCLASLPFGISFYSPSLLLTVSPYSIQLIALIGRYGGSFWIFFTCCIGQLAWQKAQKKRGATALFLFWIGLLGIPYMYGAFRLQTGHINKPVPLHIALCHMEEAPDIFDQLKIAPSQFAMQEWMKVLDLLQPIVKRDERVDLIAIPEGAIPYSAHSLVIDSKALPKEIVSSSPVVTSFEVSKMVSQLTQTPILMGAEGREDQKAFNSAFFIADSSTDRYDKRILLPFGEYIPFPSLSCFLQKYGVHGSFYPGTKLKLFSLDLKENSLLFAPLICYEETFSRYGAEAREKGASFILSISNDAWFPSPALKRLHFDLARLHAAEIGIPFLRATNMGISGAIDSNGNSILTYQGENRALLIPITVDSQPIETPYTAMTKNVSKHLQALFFHF